MSYERDWCGLSERERRRWIAYFQVEGVVREFSLHRRELEAVDCELVHYYWMDQATRDLKVAAGVKAIQLAGK